MSDPSYTKIINDGLWHNNAGLVQLLGLCPLLAITTSAINGLGTVATSGWRYARPARELAVAPPARA
jgi:Na+-translocating ferredoxin:NAD+ oxidoreductase RnfE subunit